MHWAYKQAVNAPSARHFQSCEKNACKQDHSFCVYQFAEMEDSINICLVKDIFATVCVGKIKIGRCLPKCTVELPKSISLSLSGLLELLKVVKKVLEVFVVGVKDSDELLLVVSVPNELVFFVKQTNAQATFGIVEKPR